MADLTERPTLTHTAAGWLRQVLQGIGQAAPSRLVYNARGVTDYIMLGNWIKRNQFTVGRRFARRHEVFAYVASQVQEPVLLLEFGVWRGASMRQWSELLKHPQSRLIGFDTFTGFDEDYDPAHDTLKGTLSTGGQAPVINDSRVSFVKGLFEDTLPTFRVPPHTNLIISNDCDLYSGTRTIFKHLGRYIVPGTVLLFDDMSQWHQEPKGFEEYIRESKKRFDLIAAQRGDVFAFKCLT